MFLVNPFWQFLVSLAVAIIIGLLAIYTSLWIFRKQNKRKEFSYQVTSDDPIASVNEIFRDRVEIRIDGNPIKDARLLVLKVWNSGNAAIKRDDYDEPIKFNFKGRTVISGDILGTVPIDLIDKDEYKTFLKLEQESIELAKMLLNPNESIRITVLLTGTGIEVQSRGRIVDGKIKRVNLVRTSTRVEPYYWLNS